MVRVGTYHLRTELVSFNLFFELGFVGEWEFSVSPKGSSDSRRALHLLAEFAFFVGTCLKTTMRMGETRRVSRGCAP